MIEPDHDRISLGMNAAVAPPSVVSPIPATQSSKNPNGEVARLYEEISQELLVHVRSRLPNDADAEDIVQESFAKLAGEDFGTILSPSAYLRVVTDRLVADWFRRRAIEIRYEYKLAESSEAQTSPHETIEKESAVSQLRIAIKALPYKQRTAMVLYQEGLSPAEIAKRFPYLGKSPNRVSCLLDRAKRKVHASLRAQGVSPAFIPIWFSLDIGRSFTRKVVVDKISSSFRRIESASREALVVAQSLALSASAVAAMVAPSTSAHPFPIPSRNPEIAQTQLTSFGHSSHPPSSVAGVDESQRGDSSLGSPRERSGSRAILTFSTTTGSNKLSRESRRSDPAPPIEEQILGLVDDPSNFPLPEVGGIP